ncbi:MAG TPA: metallophosphoesterase, partial [Archangium sp.]|nr:metallophosphoesterase [Archangium sp.]
LREADVPVLPVLGNHEYWGTNSQGLRHYFQRFPVLEGRRWYCLAWGRLGLVFLDSNFDELSDAQRRVQLAWLDETLRAFEADGSIRGVLLLGHHPPFTNSTVTGDERHVREHLVPRVHRFRKVLGYVSGHVHSYERFMREGKLFLVSGGGGGPRAELATGAARRHPDDLHEGPPLRPFHFLLFHPEPEGLEVEVRGLPKGGETFSTVDRFFLPWAEPGGVGTVPTWSRERDGSLSCAHSPCSFPCSSAWCSPVASGASPLHLRPRTGLSRNRRRAWSR